MKRIHLFAMSVLVTLGLILPLSLSSADDKKAAEGEALYKKNCNMCHFPDKADKKMGPGLKDLFKNKELPQSHKPVKTATIRQQIEKGSKAMPGFAGKLKPEELDNLMAYLKTL